ncbi:MAG: DUF2490 domain-containing protein [Flavobacteriales bacterium]|nr:DUF2490 domain-containing protein [Flavobacteriales bacterium]
MLHRLLCAAFLAAFLVARGSAQAQEVVTPVRYTQLWLDAEVKGKVAKRTTAIGGLGYRTGDEFGSGRQTYLNGDLRYKVNKYLDLGFEQRAVFRSIGPNRHRTGLMLLVGERFGRTTVEYRLNYQHVWRPQGTRRDFIRNKFGAEYDIPKFQFDPTASVEFFTVLRDTGAEADAVRYKVGSTWSPAKGHRFAFALVHDREQNRRRPDYRWIFAFGYRLDLGKV